MKRVVVLIGMLAFAAAGMAPSAWGQLAGMPVWNSPKAGTGLSLAADLGFPDSTGGKGATYAGRVELGVQTLTFGVTAGVRNPKGSAPNVTEYGGTASVRVVGGSLIPVAVNVQGGMSGFKVSGVASTRFTAAVGLSIDVPAPSVSIEPWVAPGVRVNHTGASGAIPSSTNTNFGVAGGFNLGFGMYGLHAALDYEKIKGGGHTTTFGLGAHLGVRTPGLGL